MLVLAASPLRLVGWLGIRIIWVSGATCMSVHSYLSEIAQ